tara:strand:+ start:802 stop:1299 length:498 start_codon:yes stop_codon:yes gene_type:complete
MKVLIAVSFILLSCAASALEYQVDSLKGVQLSSSDTIPELNISLKLHAFDKNFHFNNQLMIHHSERFNILVTANVSQSAPFKQNTAYLDTSLLNSKIISTKNDQMPTIYTSFNETKHQYGLIGSYAVTPKWHVSGGLIYSAPSISIDQAQSSMNNVALIGTSYSF